MATGRRNRRSASRLPVEEYKLEEVAFCEADHWQPPETTEEEQIAEILKIRRAKVDIENNSNKSEPHDVMIGHIPVYKMAKRDIVQNLKRYPEYGPFEFKLAKPTYRGSEFSVGFVRYNNHYMNELVIKRFNGTVAKYGKTLRFELATSPRRIADMRVEERKASAVGLSGTVSTAPSAEGPHTEPAIKVNCPFCDGLFESGVDSRTHLTGCEKYQASNASAILENVCTVCLLPIRYLASKETLKTNCGHIFCQKCVLKLFELTSKEEPSQLPWPRVELESRAYRNRVRYEQRYIVFNDIPATIPMVDDRVVEEERAGKIEDVADNLVVNCPNCRRSLRAKEFTHIW